MGECLIIRSGSGTDTSNANATTDKLVLGYTCYVDDELVMGDIPVQATDNQKVNPSKLIELPYGYYNSNIISTSTLEEETVANAVSSDLLSKMNGWVSGKLVNGTMTNLGTIRQSLGANGTYTIPSGWVTTSSTVIQSLTVQSAINVTPGTSNKTACAANRWTNGNIIIVRSGNLVSSNIKNGVTIYGVRGNFVGWVDNPLVIWNNGSVNGGAKWTDAFSGTGGYNHFNGRYKVYKEIIWCMRAIPNSKSVTIRAWASPDGTWGDNNKSSTCYYDSLLGMWTTGGTIASITGNSGGRTISYTANTNIYSTSGSGVGCGIIAETIGYGSCSWGLSITYCAVSW